MCEHCVAGKWQGLVKCWPADAVCRTRSPRRRKHERGGGAGRHPAPQLLGKRALESGKCVSIFKWDCVCGIKMPKLSVAFAVSSHRTKRPTYDNRCFQINSVWLLSKMRLNHLVVGQFIAFLLQADVLRHDLWLFYCNNNIFDGESSGP